MDASSTTYVRQQHASPAGRILVFGLGFAAAALAFARHAAWTGGVIAGFVAFVLVCLSAIDIRERRLPNRILVPTIVAVLLARVALDPAGLPMFAGAAVIAAALLMLPNLLNPAAMGMGDVKLGLLLGLALGWSALSALLLGFLSAGPVAAAALLWRKDGSGNASIPFGPFLALGALTVLLLPGLGVTGGA